MEEEIYLPYILHNLGSPLSCSNSLFGSFRWFLRVVQIIPYRGKELFERAIKTILMNDKYHLFPNNSRLLGNMPYGDFVYLGLFPSFSESHLC